MNKIISHHNTLKNLGGGCSRKKPTKTASIMHHRAKVIVSTSVAPTQIKPLQLLKQGGRGCLKK